MGLFGWPFRAKPEREAGHSRLASRQSPTGSHSPSAARREVLQLALRESLQRHGIPTSWITADALSATSRNSEAGLHWRLAIKHWDPRLMLHGVALQHSLVNRVLMYDPRAHDWLLGISWQFALPDESECPAMPHPGSWTADPRPEPAAAAHAELQPGGSADLIEGPLHISGSDSKAELDRLMAERDASFGAGDQKDFEATQKMFINTRSSDL